MVESGVAGMYWNRRFAIVVSLVWLLLVAGGYILLARFSCQPQPFPVQTGRPPAIGAKPIAP